MKAKMGMAWYRAEQWRKLREVSSDVENLEEKHEDWRVSAQSRLIELRQSGLDVCMVDVDVDELVLWCKERNRLIDAKSRSEFVADKLRKMDKGL